jgi:hypothetical protein
MTEQEGEREHRKRAIFDTMSKRGQERVLRMGYENWDPFQEPKDPRQQILSTVAMRSNAMVQQFYAASPGNEGARAYHRELVDLCMGLIRGELRAQTIYEFCRWYREHSG